MTDIISRQAAIDAICTDWCTETRVRICSNRPNRGEYNEEDYHCDGCDDVVTLQNLPSVQPERKKGHWIVVTRHEHYPSGKPYEKLQCPFCKKFDHNGDGKFCGYCGAEMQKGENDE